MSLKIKIHWKLRLKKLITKKNPPFYLVCHYEFSNITFSFSLRESKINKNGNILSVVNEI